METTTTPTITVRTLVAPICRQINLPLKIETQEIPTSRRSLEAFLNRVYPKAKIEHLGRKEVVTLGHKKYWNPGPTSLFFQTVHAAFCEHFPLSLRPEVLLYLVNSNVAEIVKSAPEKFRSLFTTVSDKQTIEVRHDGLRQGVPDSPWQEVFPKFNGQLREKVPSKIMDHMLPSFSTRSPEVDAASMVCFMDAASPYYNYRVMTLCGIPKIRMLGTAEDWEKLQKSVLALKELFGQEAPGYFEKLLPTLDILVEQANGEPQNDDFWKSLYKYKSMSGGDTFNGWLSDFLYFIQKDGKLVPRPKVGSSLYLDCAPAHISSVPFIWDYFGKEIQMKFCGGVLGIDDEGGFLTPSLSYAILEG